MWFVFFFHLFDCGGLWAIHSLWDIRFPDQDPNCLPALEAGTLSHGKSQFV